MLHGGCTMVFLSYFGVFIIIVHACMLERIEEGKKHTTMASYDTLNKRIADQWAEAIPWINIFFFFILSSFTATTVMAFNAGKRFFPRFVSFFAFVIYKALLLNLTKETSGSLSFNFDFILFSFQFFFV